MKAQRDQVSTQQHLPVHTSEYICTAPAAVAAEPVGLVSRPAALSGGEETTPSHSDMQMAYLYGTLPANQSRPTCMSEVSV